MQIDILLEQRQLATLPAPREDIDQANLWVDYAEQSIKAARLQTKKAQPDATTTDIALSNAIAQLMQARQFVRAYARKTAPPPPEKPRGMLFRGPKRRPRSVKS